MSHLRTILIAGLVGSLAGCVGEGLEEPRFATGTSTIAAGSNYEALFTANPEENTLSRVSLDDESIVEVNVGDEPTRVARLGDRLLVTLRGERAIAVLDEATMQVQQRIATGAEPYGVVASEDGTRFYVSVASSRMVEEYDGETLELLRSFATDQEPRWLALHPNGDALYVASPYAGALYWIDLEAGLVSPVDLPVVAGRSPENGNEVPLTARITGDIAISPDGRSIAIPTMQVENNAPGGDLSAPNPAAVAYYAPPGGGRFNSTVLTTSVVGGGEPADDFWEALLINVQHENLGTVGSYPSSVTYGADNEQLLLTIQSSDAVVSVPGRYSAVSRTGRAATPRINSAGRLVFQTRNAGIVQTSAGPNGVALAGDDAYVYSYFEGLVERVKDNELAAAYENAPRFGGEISALNASTVTARRMYAEPGLTPEQRAGRALFYSAIDTRMSFDGTGVSCSTCHFEGRNDGLTWPLEEGGRQTPTLAGGTAETAPVTWTLNVASAADEAMLTSQGRMGGSGLLPENSAQVAAFIESIRPVDVAADDLDAGAVARGAEAYELAGCDDCHSGARYTDNLSYEMLGLASVNTPPLTGISATAPYFHDGSAKTLREVLDFARSGEMGDTSTLTEAQMSDLETYLRSL
ncbi:MAG: c-type cytochrome [Deltaproteobacteria bacterium]|nr:c-type cytochrome [Deltaproteobacteria bacterium]